MSVSCDVAVVGAGPTGLLLAGDLAAAGVRCTVVERRDSESNLTRAFAVHARTLEQLDARGLADDLVRTGRRLDLLRLFGGVHVDLSVLPSRFPFLLVTPQYEVERLLARRARQLGVPVLRGQEVVGVRQGADDVTVSTRSAADGAGAPVRARFVVGCDGVRSAVRTAVGLPFPGRSAVRSVMLADVRLREQPEDVLLVDSSAEGFAFLAPFGDGWYRVIAWDRRAEVPDSEPVDLAALRDLTRRALGSDFGMHDARWTSRFHSDERQAPTYRVGRVLLAGDAAHVHSPAGGQGMNTGLQDAANLSWKLAAAIGGTGPAGLLDTYTAERHPVGRDVLRTSGRLLRLAMVGSPVGRALRDRVLATLVRRPRVNRLLAERVSGLAVRYPPADPHRSDEGSRVPDLTTTRADGGPTRLYEVLREGRFTVVLPAHLRAAELGGGHRSVPVVTSEQTDGSWLLVRPDGYLAASGDELEPEPPARSLRAAVQEWTGPAPQRRTPITDR